MHAGTFCIACSSFNPARAVACTACGASLRGPLTDPTRQPARRAPRRGRRPRTALGRALAILPLATALLLGLSAAGLHRVEQDRLAARYAQAAEAEAAGRFVAAADLFAAAAGYRDADVRERAVRASYEAAVRAGTGALDAGRYDEAITIFDPLAAQHPDDEEVAALVVQARIDRHAARVADADAAMLQGDWLAAERTYAALRAENPTDAGVTERLAWIQREHAPLLIGREDGIYLIGPDLDDERLITKIDSATQPVWSPDRQRIAFTTVGEDYTLFGDLYVVGVDGGGLTRLAERVAAFRGVSWSPDGTRIAYSSFAAYDPASQDGPIGLRMIEVATGVETDISQSTWDYALSPTWSPEGDRLAFVGRTEIPDDDGYREVGTGGIRIFDLATGRLTDLTGDRMADAWLLSWSPERGSDRIIVQTQADTVGYAADPTDLYAVDAASGEITPVHTSRALVSGGVWSPDGSRFAYVEEGTTLRLGVWQGGVLRHGWVRLDSPVSATLSWSPDGSAILLVAPDGWTPSLMLRFTPDGVVQKPLTIDFRMDYAESAPPQWTSRNETIAASPRSGGTALDTGAVVTPSVPLDRQRGG